MLLITGMLNYFPSLHRPNADNLFLHLSGRNYFAKVGSESDSCSFCHHPSSSATEYEASRQVQFSTCCDSKCPIQTRLRYSHWPGCI